MELRQYKVDIRYDVNKIHYSLIQCSQERMDKFISDCFRLTEGNITAIDICERENEAHPWRRIFQVKEST